MQSHAYTQSHTQLSTPAHCTPQQNDSLMRDYEKLKWVGFEGLEMFGGSGCRSAKNVQPFAHLGIGRMNSGRAVRSSEPCPHIHSAHVCMCMMCMYTRALEKGTCGVRCRPQPSLHNTRLKFQTKSDIGKTSSRSVCFDMF